jgi:hypothetical protein
VTVGRLNVEAVLPITQSTAGWLLATASICVFVMGFALRRVVSARRDSALVRRVVRTLRGSALSRYLFGPIEDERISDEELDNVILLPTTAVTVLLMVTALFLVGYDSFQVRFKLFRLP